MHLDRKDFEDLLLVLNENDASLPNKRRQRLIRMGLLSSEGITPMGYGALSPYKVRRAIIMAAGLSSRFLPLCLEKPKGLLNVKGEILIERQIRQLKEAGIDDITVIVGYKKESFYYLRNAFDVKIVQNDDYLTKNNTHTLALVRGLLENAYICSSDDYFVENPFDLYVYQSFYASVVVNERMQEWYLQLDDTKRIVGVSKVGENGPIMLGHVFFDKSFGRLFGELLERHDGMGDYDQKLWEELFVDNIDSLPPIEAKIYPSKDIFEFDSLDELREFDSLYSDCSFSNILAGLAQLLSCRSRDLYGFNKLFQSDKGIVGSFCAKEQKYLFFHFSEPRKTEQGQWAEVNDSGSTQSLEELFDYFRTKLDCRWCICRPLFG